MGTFAAHQDRAGQCVTLPVRGDVDLETIGVLEAEFTLAVYQHPALIQVDLSDVEFLDSTGLNAFVRWHLEGERTGFHVVFVAPSKSVQHLLGLTHLDELLAIARRY